MTTVRGKLLKFWAMATVAALPLVVLAGMSMTSAARADGAQTLAQEKKEFRIPPQDLASALNEFGRQSGRDILFSTQVVSAKRSVGIVGALAPDDALRVLLAGTGLNFRITSERTILVESAVQGGARSDTTTRSDASPPIGTQAADEPNDAARDRKIEKVTVTGSRIRGAHPMSPVDVYSRSEIERSGASTIEQFARRVPQNLGDTSGEAVAGGAVNQAGIRTAGGSSDTRGSAFNLRGLGAGGTLTLLNGRRIAGAGQGGAFVDVSLLPLSAIDRIEVLTDGASALYGADAIGGVVNIVLRQDYDGAESSLRYGFASEGGGRSVSPRNCSGQLGVRATS